MPKHYQLRNKLYTVVDCLEKEIPSHIERVSSYWEQSNTDFNIQADYMKQSIASELAIKCIDDKNQEIGITYTTYYKNSKHIIYGNYLWVNSNRSLAIVIHYLKTFKDIAKVFFYPHITNPIPFKDIVETLSIRRYHRFHRPLEVDMQHGKALEFMNKYFSLYNITVED